MAGMRSKVLTRGETRGEAAVLRSDRINEAIVHGRAVLNLWGIVITTTNTTEAEAWLPSINSPTLPRFDYLSRGAGWSDLDVLDRFGGVLVSTRATGPTAISVSAIRKLLELRRRDERVARMPIEHRALYHRILSRREKVGPVDLDLVEALKELRSNG
jgi:hypothetical protein